jgi:hypothetical protein
MARGLFLVLLLVPVASGCASSADSSDPSRGPTDCGGTITLSGGTSATLDANFCSGGGKAFSIGQSDGLSSGSKSTSVSFELERQLGEEETGTFVAVSSTVRARANGAEERWQAGSGACSVTLTSRAKSSIGLHYGTGTATCTGELLPVAPNAKAPVKIADFSFTAIVPGP